MARMRRACLASAVRAASARNCEILKSWCVISIADMLPAPRINDMLHRVTVAVVWESPQESGSQAAGIIRKKTQIKCQETQIEKKTPGITLQKPMLTHPSLSLVGPKVAIYRTNSTVRSRL